LASLLAVALEPWTVSETYLVAFLRYYVSYRPQGHMLLRRQEVLGWGFDLHLLDGLHYEDGVFWFWTLGLLVKFVWYWLVDRNKIL